MYIFQVSQLDEMQGRCSKKRPHHRLNAVEKFEELRPQKKQFEHLPKYCNLSKLKIQISLKFFS